MSIIQSDGAENLDIDCIYGRNKSTYQGAFEFFYNFFIGIYKDTISVGNSI